MPMAAFLIGLLIVAQGILGLAAPELFAALIRTIQAPPLIYLAAVVRVLFGAVLYRAAPTSRTPWGLRIVGALIVIGGLLTPFIGVQFAHLILGWWSEGGAAVVRAWASAALGIGAFIMYANAPIRRAA